MKVVIFAGGSGTRFWPISRNNFPKQFQPLINGKSTIELMVESVVEIYGWNSVYFSTTELLVSLIKNTFPEVPTANIITEPLQRDVGPAVGLAMQKLKKLGAGSEQVAILWGDSYPANTENFQDVLKLAEGKVEENPRQIVWLAQKPKFPNENIGWIALGDKKGEEAGLSYYGLDDFRYRPELELAIEWCDDGKHSWNTGYFVTTPDFVLEKYRDGNPGVTEKLEEIAEAMDTAEELETLQRVYPEIESVHFDHIVLDHLAADDALIVEGDFDWSDPGTLYALKQFMQESDEDNVCKGSVYPFETRDSLIYNFVNKQLVATIGLDGHIVVNTPDALLVCHKSDIGKIKELLKEFKGTELEKLL